MDADASSCRIRMERSGMSNEAEPMPNALHNLRIGLNADGTAKKTCTMSDEAKAAPLIEVGQTSRGYTLYRQENGAGGHSYWSDAVGGGAVVYDTCLASREEVEMALRIEEEFERGER